jgi:hypothetical protein
MKQVSVREQFQILLEAQANIHIRLLLLQQCFTYELHPLEISRDTPRDNLRLQTLPNEAIAFRSLARSFCSVKFQ